VQVSAVLPVWTDRSEFGTREFTWWRKSIPPQLLYASFSVKISDNSRVRHWTKIIETIKVMICYNTVSFTAIIQHLKHNCTQSVHTHTLVLETERDKSTSNIEFLMNSAAFKITLAYRTFYHASISQG